MFKDNNNILGAIQSFRSSSHVSNKIFKEVSGLIFTAEFLRFIKSEWKLADGL